MPQYFDQLNLPVKIIKDLSEYKSEKRTHVRGPKNIMGDEVDKILASVGLKIQWVEIFYLNKGADHTIHCDGHELDNKAKFNYVIGGKDSIMSWYDPIDKNKIQKKISKANTIYLGINLEDAREVYSTTMDEGFYIINAGQFHNVWNKDEGRYCLSGSLVEIDTGYRPLFNELQEILKDYIND
jgi:YHS domain-containing protein